jgi:hypothetical protein
VSSHVTLNLHLSEETVTVDFSSVLVPFPTGAMANPITDYFITTHGLTKKIIDTQYRDDAEVLGLLLLGVVSSAEFYFRSVLSELARACPLCVVHTETVSITSGSNLFYSDSGFSPTMSAFDHESLADSKKISSEIKRFAGFVCSENSSVKKALEDFELLCELRHCFVHARGFAGPKAIRALGGKRAVHKVLIKQQQALDFIKLSHNAVRAVNHYLGNEILNRWIDKSVLTGNWVTDKRLFTRYWNLFAKRGEDSYSGYINRAYSIVRPMILKRQRGVATKVAAA